MDELWPGTFLPNPDELPTPYERLVEYLGRITKDKKYFFLLFREADWIIPQLLQHAEGMSEFYNGWFSGIAQTLEETFSEADRKETTRQLKLLGYKVQKSYVPSFDNCEWWVIIGSGIIMPAAPVNPDISAYIELTQLLDQYDGVEIDPVHETTSADGKKVATVTKREDPNISYWSVFLHLREGGRERAADCPTEEVARTVGIGLRRCYHLPRPLR